MVSTLQGNSPLTVVQSIAVSVCYWLVAASIAELASAMPTAAGGASVAAFVV